jgi:hypothetical protein
MTVHLYESGGKFLCGLLRNGERSFLPVKLYGDVNPVGKTVVCPFCRAALENNNVRHL